MIWFRLTRQLTNLAVLASSFLQTEFVTTALDLKQQVEDNVVQKGKFRATDWSAIIWRIDGFVEKYFQKEIDKFDTKKINDYLEPHCIVLTVLELYSNRPLLLRLSHSFQVRVLVF